MTNTASKHFYNEVGKYPILTADEEVELFTQYKDTGDMDAREIIINSNIRLAMRIAKKYNNNGLPYEDLFQEGFIGLMTAIDKFDLSKGYRFSTYAYYVINQAIKTGLQEKKNIVRVPQYITNNLYKVKEFIEKNPETTKEEIAKEFKITEKTATAMIAQLQEISNIDKVEVEDEYSYVNTIEANDMVLQLQAAIDSVLTPAEATVVRARSGLLTDKPMNLAKTAELAKVPRDSVRLIEEIAMSKLAELDYLRVYVKGE